MTTVNSASTPLIQTGKSDRTFLTVLAAVSTDESLGSDAEGSGLGGHTGDGTAKSDAGARPEEQLPVMEVTRATRKAGANATGTIANAEQSKVLSKEAPIAQDKFLEPNRGASAPAAITQAPVNLQSSTATSDFQTQLVAVQWTQSASAIEPPAAQQTSVAGELLLNAKPSAVPSSAQAQFIGFLSTKSASTTKTIVAPQAQTVAETPHIAGLKAVITRFQGQHVSAPVQQNLSTTEPAAKQQTHSPTVAPSNSALTGIASELDAKFVVKQSAQIALPLELPAGRQPQMKTGETLNLDSPGVVPDFQERLVTADAAQNGSGPEQPGIQQTRVASEPTLSFDQSAFVLNFQEHFAAASTAQNATAPGLPAGHQTQTASEPALSINQSFEALNSQTQPVVGQTRTAFAAQQPVSHQTQAPDEALLDVTFSAAASDSQAYSVVAQGTHSASIAQLPASQRQTQVASETPIESESFVNSDSSAVTSSLQRRVSETQTTREASAPDSSGNQRARAATTPSQNELAARESVTGAISNAAQVTDHLSTTDGELATARVQLPLQAALSGNAIVGDDSETGSKQSTQQTEPTTSPGTTAFRNQNLVRSADGEANNSAPTANVARGVLSGAQGNGQLQQNTNGSPDQSGSAPARAAVNNPPQAQVQAIPTPAASSHDAVLSVATSKVVADGSHFADKATIPGSNQQEIGAGAATTGINSVKLIQAMGQTEMRVGLQSNEFGDISIRTSVSQQQIQTQISLDHSELSQAIAAHISSVQTKLGDEHGLQASIQINNQGSSHFGNSGQPSQRQQNAFAGSTRSADVTDYVEADNGIGLGTFATTDNEHRLDIRA